ncbi:MAG: S41 family peptidase [Spirochaetia bacterium]|jgi:carboxyl-terminal processing protease|nr:S41 family peptidase [Spirochaetia bacterium]
MDRIRKIIVVLMLLSPCLLFAGGSSSLATQQSTYSEEEKATSNVITNNFNNLEYLYRVLDQISLNPLDSKKAMDDMTKALVASIGDEYSFFVPEEDAEDYKENITGIYEGIGTYLIKYDPSMKKASDKETYMIKITSPFPGGPTERAGLRAGDLIGEIDGKPVDDLTANEASKQLRGKAGTKVELTIWRGEKSFKVTVTRAVVKTPTVEKAVIHGHIGYLIINQFTSQTSQQATEALKDILEENIDALVIDLRNNGGGDVQSCKDIADLFLDHKLIMSERYNGKVSKEPSEIYSGKGVTVPRDLPVVILVNGGTASASEILTGALRDNGRATVIGSKTFGKGIEQQVLPFNGGYLQVTIAHYYTPSGKDIHKKGIQPDIEVPEKDYDEKQLQAMMDLRNDNVLSDFIKENSDYTKENIEKFAKLHADSVLDHDTLCLLIRNEYLYEMDYSDRPVYDLDYDPVLIKAVDFLEKGTK